MAVGFGLGRAVSPMTAIEAGGQPDYVAALQQGFQGAADVYKPRAASEQLLSQMLTNKMNKPKAEHAEEWFQSELASNQALAGLHGAQRDAALSQLRQQKMLSDLLSGNYNKGQNSTPNQDVGIQDTGYDNSSENVSSEGPGIAPSASAYDTFPGRRTKSSSPSPTLKDNVSNAFKPAITEQGSTIINPGNPNLSHIDKAYETRAELRPILEKQGYKKSVVTKYDPKTGLGSIITTYPSGKIEMKPIGQAPKGGVPLTNAIKTLNQNVIGGVPKVTKLIDKLISSPSPSSIRLDKPNEKAEHESLVLSAAETYAKAKGWPNTNESINAARKILDRHFLESDKAYRTRLNGLKSMLSEDVISANEMLGQPSSAVSSNNDPLGIR